MPLPVPVGHMGRGWQLTAARPTADGGAWFHFTLTSGQRLWRYLPADQLTPAGVNSLGDLTAELFDYWPGIGNPRSRRDAPRGPGGTDGQDA